MKNFLQQNRTTFLAVTIVVAVVLGAWLFQASRTAPSAEAAWFHDAWRYRLRLSIDQSKVDEKLTSFPVAVILDSTRIDYTKTQNSGQDIRFTDMNGNLLDYEIEKWDETGTSVAWVRFPEVEAGTDTVFYLYYGNTTIGDGQNASAVWDSNYKLVQHLEEGDSTAANFYKDSTTNANHGTLTDADGDSVVGTKIDGAFDFNGDADRINVGDQTSLEPANFTLSFWHKMDNYTGSLQGGVAKGAVFGNGSEYSYKIDFHNGNTNGAFTDSGNTGYGVSTSIGDGNSHLWTLTYDGANVRLYKDGTQAGSAAATAAIDYTKTENDFVIGSRQGGLYPLNGVTDEVRVSDVARSAAYIKASYNSENDSLLTYGQEQVNKGPVGYWSFDEGFGTTAFNMMNATGTDGTLTNGPRWTESGRCVSDNCLEFDGSNDYVDVGNPLGGSSSGNKTVSVWIKPTSATVGYAVANYDASSNGFSVLFNADQTIGIAWTGTVNAVQTTETIPLNQWAHIGAVFDSSGNNGTIYINGAARKSGSLGSELTTTNKVRISGRWVTANSGTAAPFDGFIDEVKIYDYARSAAEIKSDFLMGQARRGGSASFGPRTSVLSEGLQGYWKMDETSANTCSGGVNDSCDSSGAGRDGAWNGNAGTTGGKFGAGVTMDGTGDYVDAGDIDW